MAEFSGLKDILDARNSGIYSYDETLSYIKNLVDTEIKLRIAEIKRDADYWGIKLAEEPLPVACSQEFRCVTCGSVARMIGVGSIGDEFGYEKIKCDHCGMAWDVAIDENNSNFMVNKR